VSTTPSPPSWFDDGLPFIWLPYTQMKSAFTPLPIVATKGSRLVLSDGRELIDAVASWWTACHGYNHPHIMDAMKRQIDVMPHVMFGGLNHEPGLVLAKRLCALLPEGLDHVFYVDSGSVAVELSLKIALQYWANKGEENRRRFICFRNGYHGDTCAAMSVSDQDDGMHSLFKGYFPPQFLCDLPHDSETTKKLDDFLAKNSAEIAAIIIEPLVQGAGGMKFHQASCLETIVRLAREHNVLLIADEVMTGFGRTGSMFACEEASVSPDIVCLSKALTGGTIGMATTIVSDKVYEAFLGDGFNKALKHGPTFMANPLACAAANASLDLFEKEPRLEAVSAIEAHFRKALEPCCDLPGVKDVRTKGAIAVVQLEEMRHLDWIKTRFIEEGIWLRPFGNIVYATPPFTITDEDLSHLSATMVRILNEWAEKA
jgi:adenosylmethionine---8-amino-7-oxononanoate aminotransferase